MSGTERSPGDFEQEKAELKAILNSKIFTRATSLARLLSYLCGKYFDGQADQIKEYTIAVEFFDREEDFDSKDSPIVRVEAGRLRAKLAEYYRTEGRNHPIRIFIASGQYAPGFQRHQPLKPPGDVIGDGRAADTAEVNALKGNSPSVAPNENAGASEERSESIEKEPSKVAAFVSRWSLVAAASVVGLALVVTAIVLFNRFSNRTPRSSSSAPPATVALPPVPALPENPEVRIMAGSRAARYIDPVGRDWVGDRYYSGGEVFTPSPTALQRAEDSQFCKQAREGDFEYAIPINPGTYELHLYFVEMQYGFEPDEGGDTSRIFHVLANDTILLDSVDVFSDAGGGGRVYERVFTDISPSKDGRLHLSFHSSVKGKAIVSGLEILPGIRGKMRPLRITTRASSYLASDQQLWEPDRYYLGGRTVTRLRQVETTRDPELYQSERYGNFMYGIPVAKGHYQLTLKFAETYFGTPNPLHVGPLNRLFDVYCNGLTLLKNFDITREAGGVNRPLDRTFHGIEPNAQGKLILSFVPVVNYACVNAIEIVSE